MDNILRLLFAFFISKYIANRAYRKNELTNSAKNLGKKKIQKLSS